jgi:hypothetical protein
MYKDSDTHRILKENFLLSPWWNLQRFRWYFVEETASATLPRPSIVDSDPIATSPQRVE